MRRVISTESRVAECQMPNAETLFSMETGAPGACERVAHDSALSPRKRRRRSMRMVRHKHKQASTMRQCTSFTTRRPIRILSATLFSIPPGLLLALERRLAALDGP